MSHASNSERDAGALSSVASSLEDLTARLTEVADRYASSPASGVAQDLYAAERALINAVRMIGRAREELA